MNKKNSLNLEEKHEIQEKTVLEEQSEDSTEEEEAQTIEKPKPKKERTEKQKAATELMLKRLREKWDNSKKKKAEDEEQRKKEIEEKIIKKAQKIRLKQMKKEILLNEISDEDSLSDSSVKSLKEIIKQKKATPVPVSIPKPQPVISIPAQQPVRKYYYV